MKLLKSLDGWAIVIGIFCLILLGAVVGIFFANQIAFRDLLAFTAPTLIFCAVLWFIQTFINITGRLVYWLRYERTPARQRTIKRKRQVLKPGLQPKQPKPEFLSL